ncbi:hypothetical protein [Streptomyces sp. NPDC054849]
MESWQCSPAEVTVPQLDLDPYRFPGAATVESATCEASPHSRPGDTDWQLPPCGEGSPQAHWQPYDPRLTWSLQPSDRRRLDLHAALTTIGIPPLPDDLEAIHTLSALDDTTHAALVRWITTSR